MATAYQKRQKKHYSDIIGQAYLSGTCSYDKATPEFVEAIEYVRKQVDYYFIWMHNDYYAMEASDYAIDMIYNTLPKYKADRENDRSKSQSNRWYNAVLHIAKFAITNYARNKHNKIDWEKEPLRIDTNDEGSIVYREDGYWVREVPATDIDGSLCMVRSKLNSVPGAD